MDRIEVSYSNSLNALPDSVLGIKKQKVGNKWATFEK